MTPIDPKRDLVLTRTIDVPPDLVWEAWTKPEHLSRWFCPQPWSIADCEIDLRPGGIFRTVMRSPEGQEFPSSGCYLEVVPPRRLVFTNVLLPGYRPASDGQDLRFTAIITIEPAGTGTLYVATALHPDEATRDSHEAMGFAQGWGKALDQLVELTQTLGRGW